MRDPRTDLIAREAARLIGIGRTDEIDTAIRLAAGSLGLSGVPSPSVLRVRRHAQAMTMQSLGQAGYEEARIKVWRIAEELMTALEHALPDDRTLLVGRAAEGHIDAGVTIHIRLYGRGSIIAVAQSLIDLGYNEPRFETIETRHGRLSQLRLTEDDLEIAVTRCPPALAAEASHDLFSGRVIETVDLPGIRRKLALAEKPK